MGGFNNAHVIQRDRFFGGAFFDGCAMAEEDWSSEAEFDVTGGCPQNSRFISLRKNDSLRTAPEAFVDARDKFHNDLIVQEECQSCERGFLSSDGQRSRALQGGDLRSDQRFPEKTSDGGFHPAFAADQKDGLPTEGGAKVAKDGAFSCGGIGFV